VRTIDRRKDHRNPRIIERLKEIQPQSEKEMNLVDDVVGDGFKQNEPDYTPKKRPLKIDIIGQDKRKLE